MSVLQILHVTASRLMAVTADPCWVPAGKEQLATAALDLLHAAEPGSDHQLAWAQLLGWTAVTPDSSTCRRPAGRKRGDPGLDVDTELRWALLRRLAATGRAGDAEIDAELDGTRPMPAAGTRGLPGRDTGRRAQGGGLAPARGTRRPRLEGVLGGRGASASPSTRICWPRTWSGTSQVLPEIWAAQRHVRRLLGDALFPYYGRVTGAARPGWTRSSPSRTDPAISRVVIERRDVVERALRPRACRPDGAQAAGRPSLCRGTNHVTLLLEQRR